VAAAARSVPPVALWLPTAVPALLTGNAAAGAGAALVLIGVAMLWAVPRACETMVREGLLAAGGSPFQGTRAARASGRVRFRGMLGKEFLLLVRDKTFLVQTLLTPLVILAFQVIINPRILSGAGGRGAPTLAFGVGAYVLMFGGFSVLAVERTSLWLLFTFPQPLAQLLRRKTALWACVALVYSVVTLACVWRPASLGDCVAPLFALAGVVLCAVVAAGCGALATDPFEETPGKRVPPEWAYFYMLIVSMLGFSVYAGSIHSRIVVFSLVALVGYAIWQRADERLRLLLDPTALPPRRLGLADGLFATLIFFMLQQLAHMILNVAAAHWTPGMRILFAYAIAGVAAAGIMLYALWRLAVPALHRTVGLVGGASARVCLFWGLAGGAVAAGAGALYLRALDAFDALRPLREGATQAAPEALELAMLAVVFAPFVEEFLFRGLLYRGLRATAGPRASILACALIFASVHPPASFLPVFVLGLVAAWTFERTGSLWTPILAHAVYNAGVVALQLY
jgi:membrane protease YdiL (CAAX protease family)